jgi:DNA-binding transcriptional MerR regulator
VGERSYLSIGDVLALLREEFPDITISKIRFLESRGLLVPERTPSGYRKFYDHDVDRLRWILRQQREHFLPLKVIKGRLEGAEPASQPESLFDSCEGPPEELAGSERSTYAPSEGRTAVESNGTHLRGGERLAPAAAGARVATMPRQRATSAPTSGHAASSIEPGTVTDLPMHRHPSSGPSVVGAASSPPRPPAASESERPAPEPPPPPAPEPRGAGAAVSAATTTGADTTASPTEGASSSEDETHAGQGSGAAALPGATLTAGELAHASGLTITQVEELESYGLIEGRTVAGVHCFDEEALVLAKLAADFRRYGVEARHLRIFKHAAERQSGLYSQVVMPLLRQRNPAARAKAHDDLQRLAELGTSLQACFSRAVLRELTGG